MVGRVSVRLAVFVALALALAPVATAGAQSSYRVVEIGTVAGFDTSTGDDVNASGQVVGTLGGRAYLGESSAFVWDPSSGLRALGKLAGTGTFGTGINDRGVVTGAAPAGHVYFGVDRLPLDRGRRLREPGAGRLYIQHQQRRRGGRVHARPGLGALGRARPNPSGSARCRSSMEPPRRTTTVGQIVGNASGGGPAQLFDRADRPGPASPLPGRRHRACLRHQRPGTRRRGLASALGAEPKRTRPADCGRSLAPSSGATASQRR